MRYAEHVRKRLHAGAAILASLACGCSGSDVIHFVHDPSPGRFVYYLLLAPLAWFAKELLAELVGEAVRSLLPPWMKTRRAVWSAVALATLATMVAVAWMNATARR